jgi:hypothetical protein
MKKFLSTTAVALVAMAGTASAQSVLERVLGQIDNTSNLASINGTFANIAENIGGTGSVSEDGYTNGSLTLTADEFASILVPEQAAADAAYDLALTLVEPTLAPEPLASDAKYIPAGGAAQFTSDKSAWDLLKTQYDLDIIAYDNMVVVAEAASDLVLDTFNALWDETVIVTEMPGLLGVDGSITTTVEGVSEAISQATEFASSGDAEAYEFNLPTLNIGNLSTTALGAVNTGDITLGVNSTVDEAKTTSTQAVSSVMAQLGGSSDTGALVLNVASNMTGVNGSITTTMTDVNGTINSAATTALGAVNTGTIVSGVDAAVQGIVGVSGQSTVQDNADVSGG